MTAEVDEFLQQIQWLLRQVEAELAQPFLEFGANPSFTNWTYHQIAQTLTSLRENVIPLISAAELAQANPVYAAVLQIEGALSFVAEVQWSGQGSTRNTTRLRQLLQACEASLGGLGLDASSQDGYVDDARSAQPLKRESNASHPTLSEDTSRELWEFLRGRPEMRSNEALKAFFGATPLRKWQAELPEATSEAERTDGVISYLSNKIDSSGKKGLFVLLDALQARIDPGDATFATVALLLRELG